MTTSPAPQHRTGSPATLWRNKPYLLLMTGKTTQLIGAGVGAFAVPLLAYRLTGSVAQAGVISAVGQIGGLLMTLPAGVIADRVDRRRLIISGALLGMLAWGSVAVAGATGLLTGWHLAAALFVSSLVTAFVNPAEGAAIRVVVEAEQMPQAMAAVQGRGAVASLAAGPIGGLLYGIGHVVPVLASAVGELTVAVCTASVRRPLNGDLGAARERHPLAALADGIRFVWSVPLFRASLGLFTVINLSADGLIIAITLHLVQDHTAPFLIGLIDFVFGAAMLIGSLFTGRLLQHVRVALITVVTFGVLAGCAVGMALVQQYWAYLVLLTPPLLLAPALNAGIIGYAGAITPDTLQGRLNSVLGLTGLAAAPLSPVLASQLLAALGIGRTLWVLAAILMGTSVTLCFIRPLWRIGRPDSWAADAITDPLTAQPMDGSDRHGHRP